MTPTDPKAPRNFFLNERHELESTEKDGGGGHPNIGVVNWSAKATSLKTGFARARASTEKSRDPVSRHRFFLTAIPAKIPRYRDNKGKREDFEERADFRNARSADLARLGLDLLAVDDDGRALVHAPSERFSVLERTASVLHAEQDRARNRWLALEGIDIPDGSWRIDRDWLAQLGVEAADCIVELVPVLTRAEAESVISAIFSEPSIHQRVVGSGTDYSGRSWWRAKLPRKSVEWIANQFPSVQLVHPPYGTDVASPIGADVVFDKVPTFGPSPPVGSLPVVGIVDCGVSDNHPVLSAYRTGRWRSQAAVQPGFEHHAAKVATRVVFGRVGRIAAPPLVGECAFFDIATGMKPAPGTWAAQFDDKDILTSMGAAIGTAAGLRTFVCAFDNQPVGLLSKAEREEKLRLVRDLDNFIAANDVIVVVSAGNVKPEVVPQKKYPQHLDDANWQLGPWASAHNTLTCGGYLASKDESAIAAVPEAPSPFTRVGPGFADANAVPDAAEHAGGDLGGVIVLDDAGKWKNTGGTSFSAPLLAREAAKSFVALARYCPADGRASSALVKAYLALTATRVGRDLPTKFKPLVKRALGAGRMTVDRLLRPTRESAVFLWQGVVEGPDDVVRVLLPLPRKWLQKAGKPYLRLVTAWNTYVNDVASSLWSCRRVDAQLRVGQGKAEAIHPSAERLGATYPRSVRSYDLGKPEVQAKISDDGLVLCISYHTDSMAPMLSFVAAGPEQAVAFGAELFDASGQASPFEEVVALESRVGVMDRLRAAIVPVRVGLMPAS